MKNLAISALIIATLSLGGLYVLQKNKAHQAEIRHNTLQEKVNELQSNAEEQQKQAQQLQEQVEQARADTAAKSAEAAQAERALQQAKTVRSIQTEAGPGAGTGAKSSNPLGDLFKSPEMREMIKNQQKAVLGTMVDKNYGKLFSALHLTPDQSSTLKGLILDKQLTAADLGMSMLSGEQDATNRAQLAAQVKASTEAADAQIKQFLGEDNFAQYETYEKTMAERMSVTGFKDQLSSGTAALSDVQEQQLIDAMSEERSRFKFTTDLSNKSSLAGDLSAMLNEDKLNGFLDEMAQLNQKYVQRASGILAPDQLSAFQTYLNNQQTLQKAGLQMATKMFAPAKAAGN